MTDTQLRDAYLKEPSEELGNEIIKRFLRQSGQEMIDRYLDYCRTFNDKFERKDYVAAKYVYDTALRLTVFLHIPSDITRQVFGTMDDDWKQDIPGIINRRDVDKVFKEVCVKNNLGQEMMIFRVPGEIGYFKPTKLH